MSRHLLPLLFASALLAESPKPAATPPATTAPRAPAAPQTEREKIYAEKIAPIMERSCVSCHSAKMAKGRFRADTLTGLVRGGEDQGPGITWGKARESTVYLLSAANRSEKMAMPPRKSDKPALTAAELETLKNWIETSK